VSLVLDFKAVRQVEAFLELSADLHDSIFVVAVAGPDG
jgi:hypothetical protein